MSKTEECNTRHLSIAEVTIFFKIEIEIMQKIQLFSVYCYSYTFIIQLAILTFHVCLDFARHVLPEDIELPFQVSFMV